ncbi:MAG: sulfite exporter TauE/SafE family protein [Pseudomonadota bacterium]
MIISVLLLFLTGVLAGVLAGLLGIGGGLVIVPLFSWMLMAQGVSIDMAVSVAVATSLASMLLTSASAIGFHARRRVIALEVLIRLGPAVAIGAVAGAVLATVLSGDQLAKVFAVAAGLIGVRMSLGIRSAGAEREPFPRHWWLLGPGIGAVSAMIGIGGGSFNVPYLRWNGYAMVNAVATASACGWVIGLSGTVAFLLIDPAVSDLTRLIGHVHWPAALLIGVVGALAAPAGVALAHRLPAERLSRIFGVVLTLVALRMGLS